MKFNSIFITGGAGYCGSRLVPFLLSKGMKVTVFDLFFFGNYLPKDNKNLFLIKGDIRDIKKIREAQGLVSINDAAKALESKGVSILDYAKPTGSGNVFRLGADGELQRVK